MKEVFNLAIDANEANVENRVGSNTYAFEIINSLYSLLKNRKNIKVTLLLANKPLDDLPSERDGWTYQVIGPKKFWTQWALPLHLFLNQGKYGLLFTPSHYAPRISIVPYVSSIMDLAYLHYPEQFNKTDLFQLKNWSKYSIKHAKKIVTISEFSKKEIIEFYEREAKDILVAYPAVSTKQKYSELRFKSFKRKQKIKNKYFLYLGTLQPRKNLIKLIEGYEIFRRFLAARETGKKIQSAAPQLVIAGKKGWMAKPILQRIENSPFAKNIILTGYVSSDLKTPLYKNSLATILVGLHEGFGIPPLEALSVGTIPIVSDSTSLPEVVGSAGIKVDPNDPHSIAAALKKSWKMTKTQRERFEKRALKQVKKFSWDESAKKILRLLESVVKE